MAYIFHWWLICVSDLLCIKVLNRSLCTIVRIGKRQLRKFFRPTIRPAAIQLLVDRLNNPAFSKRRRDWIEPLIKPSGLNGLTPLSLLDRLHVQSESPQKAYIRESYLTPTSIFKGDSGTPSAIRSARKRGLEDGDDDLIRAKRQPRDKHAIVTTLPEERSQQQVEQESQKSTLIVPQKRNRNDDVTNSSDKRLRLMEEQEDQQNCPVVPATNDAWESVRMRIDELKQIRDQTADHLKRLLPGNWLNDELINTILGLFAWGPQVRVLNTFFLDEGWKPNSRLLSVRAPVEQLVVPVCRGKHWTLLFVHIGSRIIDHYDSLPANRPTAGHEGCDTCQLMARTVDDALETAGTWTFQDEQNHERSLSPQQTNMIDCGVFLLYNAYCLSRRLDPWQDTVIPHDWRLRWARELVQQGLSHPTEEDMRKAETLSSMEKVERQVNPLSVNAKGTLLIELLCGVLLTIY